MNELVGQLKRLKALLILKKSWKQEQLESWAKNEFGNEFEEEDIYIKGKQLGMPEKEIDEVISILKGGSLC